MQPLTLKTLRAFLMEEGRGEALCLSPDPAWDEGEGHYFCTPLGAVIIGSAGVDGIHFCQLPGQERVYAVSPMNGDGERVHPVAENLGDFCRLLLACGSTAAIEQAWQWDKEAFIRFVEADQPDAEGRTALEALAEAFSLERMEDPYDYMAKVREGFSESDLIYPAEEEPGEALPGGREEKCRFSDFYGEEVQYPLACEPIPFSWGGEEGRVLGYGVVGGWFIADVAFHWSRERVGRMLAEKSRDPYDLSVSLSPAHGQMKEGRGCGLSYFPGYMTTDREWEHLLQAGQTILHYHLEASQCWEIQRAGFRWEEGFSGPVALTITHDPYWKEAARFTVSEAGQSFPLPHPDGGNLMLHVTAFEPEDIGEHLPGQRGEGPGKLREMHYTLTPDPGKNRVMLRDTAPGDCWKCPPSDGAIGVIGGADGPTAIVVGVLGKEHGAASSLYYEVPESVTWSYQFQYQDPEEVEIALPME